MKLSDIFHPDLQCVGGGWGPGFLLVVVPNGHWVFFSKTTTRDDGSFVYHHPFSFS